MIPRDSSKTDIKVVVIDDGIDLETLDIAIASGKTFASPENNTGDFFVGSGAQGTLVASVINRLLPEARLYIARIEEYTSKGNELQISSTSLIDVSNIPELVI
jgi:hypothetical protein